MTFNQLIDFLENRMRMSHIYLPEIKKALVKWELKLNFIAGERVEEKVVQIQGGN